MSIFFQRYFVDHQTVLAVSYQSLKTNYHRSANYTLQLLTNSDMDKQKPFGKLRWIKQEADIGEDSQLLGKKNLTRESNF